MVVEGSREKDGEEKGGLCYIVGKVSFLERLVV